MLELDLFEKPHGVKHSLDGKRGVVVVELRWGHDAAGFFFEDRTPDHRRHVAFQVRNIQKKLERIKTS